MQHYSDWFHLGKNDFLLYVQLWDNISFKDLFDKFTTAIKLKYRFPLRVEHLLWSFFTSKNYFSSYVAFLISACCSAYHLGDYLWTKIQGQKSESYCPSASLVRRKIPITEKAKPREESKQQHLLSLEETSFPLFRTKSALCIRMV